LRLREGGVVAVDIAIAIAIAVTFLKDRAQARSSIPLTAKTNTAAPRRHAGTRHTSDARRPLSSAYAQERNAAAAAFLDARHAPPIITRHPRTTP
jgi:hypothetical protein